jgi:hypothetical protein
MRTIVLNSNNLVQDGLNNKLVYRFPNSVLFKNTYVAVQSASLYYSWYNISASLGNNIFQFYFPDAGGLMTLYTVTFPDGIYEVTDLSSYLQFFCLENGLYYTTPAGSNVFYITLAVNISLYAVQMCCYTVPSTLYNPNSYTPAFGTALSAVQHTLVPVVGSKFCETIGWPTPAQLTDVGIATGLWTGTDWEFLATPSQNGILNLVPYNWNATTQVVAYSSNNSPQVNPNGSIYISLNNINNPYAIPSTTIYAITPTGTAGSAIIEKPPQFCWNKFIDGTYNQIVLTLLGLDGTPIAIQDPQMTFLLAIKDGDEYGGKG